MLATVHIQMVTDLWRTQARPQHKCQLSKSAPFGGPAVKHVIHAVASYYLPLNPMAAEYIITPGP